MAATPLFTSRESGFSLIIFAAVLVLIGVATLFAGKIEFMILAPNTALEQAQKSAARDELIADAVTKLRGEGLTNPAEVEIPGTYGVWSSAAAPDVQRNFPFPLSNVGGSYEGRFSWGERVAMAITAFKQAYPDRKAVQYESLRCPREDLGDYCTLYIYNEPK